MALTTLGFNIISRYHGAGVARARIDIARLNRAMNSSHAASRLMAAGLSTAAAAAEGAATQMGKLPWPALVAGLAAIGPIAAVAGAALTVGLGAAFVGLGALALKGDKQVSGAFQHMKASILATLRTSAAPMKSFLVDGMRQAEGAVRRLGPALRTAFSAAGPLVEPLVRAITNFAQGALPGMTAALGRARPVMDAFARAMGTIGKGVGQMFDQMTRDPAGLARVWDVLGTGIAEVLVSLGRFMSMAASNGTVLLTLKGTFIALRQAVDALGLVIDGLDFGKHIPTWLRFIGVMDSSAKKSDFAGVKMFSMGTKAGFAAGKVQSLKDKLSALNGQLSATGAILNFEQAVDDFGKAAGKTHVKLGFLNGKLDLNKQKTRDAVQPAIDLAHATLEAADAALQNGGSQGDANKILQRGADQLRKNRGQYGLTTASVETFIKQLGLIPKAKNTNVTAKGAKAAAGHVKTLVDYIGRVHSKSVTISAFVQYKGASIAKLSAGRLAEGGPVGGYAAGGSIPGYPHGGPIRGVGGSTSDSNLIAASRGEFMIKERSARKIGTPALHAINRTGQLPVARGGGGITVVINNPSYTGANAGPEFERQIAGALVNLKRKGRLKGVTT